MAITMFIATNVSSQNGLNKTLKKVDKALNEVNEVLSGEKKQEENREESVPGKKEETVQQTQVQQEQQVKQEAALQLFEPLYMGLNGEFTSVEITEKQSGTVEVYTFDNHGRLSERRVSNASKKIVTEKDFYIRNSAGDLIEIYNGFNLNDKKYIGESRWRLIEKKDNKERWQKIDDSWWGTEYREIEYRGNQRGTMRFVIQKENGKRSNSEFIVETFNERGQVISELTDKGPNFPKITIFKTYNEKGHLLKEDMEHVQSNGTTQNITTEKYTINNEDEHGNPLQVTDDRGTVKIYKYFKTK